MGAMAVLQVMGAELNNLTNAKAKIPTLSHRSSKKRINHGVHSSDELTDEEAVGPVMAPTQCSTK